MKIPDERRKYLRKVQPMYLKADRAGKGQLLEEMGAVAGLHCKSLVRLLKGDLMRGIRVWRCARACTAPRWSTRCG